MDPFSLAPHSFIFTPKYPCLPDYKYLLIALFSQMHLRLLPSASYFLLTSLIFNGGNVFCSFFVLTGSFTDSKHREIIFWSFTGSKSKRIFYYAFCIHAKKALWTRRARPSSLRMFVLFYHWTDLHQIGRESSLRSGDLAVLTFFQNTLSSAGCKHHAMVLSLKNSISEFVFLFFFFFFLLTRSFFCELIL